MAAQRDVQSKLMNKVILFSGLALISLLGGFILEAFLGAWTHHRYWNGTMAEVKKADAEIILGFFDEEGLRKQLLSNPDVLPKVLEDTVKPFLAIRLERDGQIKEIREENRVILEELGHRMIGGQGLRLSVHRYAPPSWRGRLARWTAHPTEWFDEKYDTITIPFLFLSAIVFGVLVSFVWRYRARYVEQEIKALLEDVDASR